MLFGETRDEDVVLLRILLPELFAVAEISGDLTLARSLLVRSDQLF